jgi:cell shape-determining protein MreC
MIYRQKNKKTGYRKYVIIGIFFVALFFFGSFFKNLIQGIASPVLNIHSSIFSSLGNVTTYFKSKNELQKVNSELIEQNQDFKIQLLTLESVQKENESLKNQLNFISPSIKTVVVKIFTRPPFSPYDTFVINSNDQIKKDQKVFYKKLLIGKVIETYSKTAVIKLYSSSGEKIPVQLSNNEFEAEGQGNLSFKIKIPKSLIVEKNTPVYSLETNSILGLVQNIYSDEASAFQDIYFRYPININDLDYVEVSI